MQMTCAKTDPVPERIRTPFNYSKFSVSIEGFFMVLQNFIVFEGIDGAGTTTQLELLKNRKELPQVRFTAEPTTAPTGVFLRSMLKGEFSASEETAAYLFAADRAEHVWGPLRTCNDRTVVTGIQSACEQGCAVISDRYLFSSLAYQGSSSSALAKTLNSTFPLPQLVFFFDIAPEASLKRICNRTVREIYEKSEFLAGVAERYRALFSEYSSLPEAAGMKIVQVDAAKTKEEIAQIIWTELQNLPIFRM